MTFRTCRQFVLAVGVCLVLVSTLHSQMPVSTSTTATPVPGAGHDYLGEINDTVDPASGSVSIRLNAMVPPGRGLTLPFSFAYDSNGANYVGHALGNYALTWLPAPTTITAKGGWSNSAPVVSANQITWTASNNASCWAFINYVYEDAKGNRHNLNLTTYNQPGNQNSPCTWDVSSYPWGFAAQVVTQAGEAGASPGQGAILSSISTNGLTPGPVSVSEPDGTSLYFPNLAQDGGGTMATLVEDRNGNEITINPPTLTAPAYSYVDTVGRPVLQDTGFGVSPEYVTIAGLNSQYILQWQSWNTPSFNAPVIQLSGSCPTYFGHAPWTGEVVLSSLTLPNNKTFTFTYDSTYGTISKITYPTGGYVRYVWGLNSQAEYGQYAPSSNPQDLPCSAYYAVPAITDRYVSFDGTNVALHQQFGYSTSWSSNNVNQWLSKQTTVTTTDNVRNTSYATIYTYSPIAADIPPNTGGGPTQFDHVESSIAYCADASVSKGKCVNPPLKTVYKTWANPRLLLSQETQYPSGQANETVWSYNSREQQTEQDDYDYGTSGVGGLLRKTVTNYQTFSSAAVADGPCQVITKDGTGNPVAETDYFYDNGATGTPCGAAGTPSVASAGGSTLTGHDGTNYSASSATQRGNVTQKTQWLSTGRSPVTKYSYDETGQLVKMIDPCGNATCSDMPTGASHTTTYSYGDSFLNTNSGGFTTTAGSPPSGKVTNAYLTQITDPLGHTETFSYGYNNGEVTQSKDQNTQPTKYKYNDSLGRLTETDYPDGGETSLSYNDSTPSVTTTKLITSSLSLSTTDILDGLGHTTQTQLTSDPEGTDYVDTVYDGMGHVYTRSNPHRSSSSPTDGTTAYTYDALGRTTNITEPDTSAVATSYSGNTTTVTDEAGNQRISVTDGLGRLTEVEEPSQGSGAPATATISVSGGIQSIQYPGTPGKGTVVILGGEQSVVINTCQVPQNGTASPQTCTKTIWDAGTVSITVNGFLASASYGQLSTQASVAGDLAAAFNGNSSSPVTATVSSNQITLTSKALGSASNYSMSATSKTNLPTYFSGPSFTPSPSGSTLTGGQNGSTTYDYGTVSATVNGCTASASYSESGNNTASAVASALAAALSGTCSSQVSATASGATITLTTTATGPFADNYTLSVTSATGDPGQFSSPSFTGSASGFGGGSDFGGSASPWTTLYTYDALNDLTNVTQNGDNPSNARIRTFGYDSLARLTSATNPESGTLIYTYDDNSNLSAKKAPAPNQTVPTTTVTTNYFYDALNRLTSKTYTDNTTPGAHFLYDVAPSSWTNPSVTLTNIVGRMTEAYTDGATWSGAVFGYDPMGRVNVNNQCTPGTCGTKNYAVAYKYDLLGDMTQSSNGFTTFTYTPYDGAGRATGITSSLVGAQYPGTLVTVDPSAGYWPNGALRLFKYGNLLTESSVYNNRLQPCRLNLNSSATALSTCADQVPSSGNIQDFNLGYGSPGNNGNVMSILATGTTGTQTFVRGFTYDRVNRLLTMTNSSATESCGGLQWTYDAWGNRTNQQTTSGSCFQSNAAATVNNQLVGYTYDAAGNLMKNSGTTYYYDAENRLIQVNGTFDSCSTATQCYGYDAFGRRTEKVGQVATSWNDRIYDLSDRVVAQASATGGVAAYIYLNGSLVTQYSNATTYFVQTDHLGSTRTMTCYAASTTGGCSGSQVVRDSMDFGPFGEQIAGDNVSIHKFTGKERDSESGLDNFGARHYGSSLGRFMQPDPIFFQAEMLSDPQRFNQYAYVRNNPLALVDPNGESIELTCSSTDANTCAAQRQQQLQALQQAVGAQAGSYLYQNAVTTTDASGNSTTKYYVGVYTNGPSGQGPAFGSINSAPEAIGNIISDSRVAELNLVPAGTTVTNNLGETAQIGPIGSGSPGATYVGQDGQLHVTLLDTSTTSPGQLPPDYMSNHQPGVVDAGILAGHEFGHVRYEWGGFWRQLLDNSNSSAVRLENDVRKLRDPNAPTRTQH